MNRVLQAAACVGVAQSVHPVSAATAAVSCVADAA
jgi:hypothetical protein